MDLLGGCNRHAGSEPLSAVEPCLPTPPRDQAVIVDESDVRGRAREFAELPIDAAYGFDLPSFALRVEEETARRNRWNLERMEHEPCALEPKGVYESLEERLGLGDGSVDRVVVQV